MSDDERQQVRQATIEEMLMVAINACPLCVHGMPKLPPGSAYARYGPADHFNGSAQWPCLTYAAVEAIREAALQP